MKRLGMSMIWMFIAAAIGSAQSTVYFPQVVGGIQGGVTWQTAFAITNPAPVNTAATTVTVTLTQDNGTPFNIAANFENSFTGAQAGTGNTISFQFSGGQTRFFDMQASGPLVSGYAKITATVPIVATSLFSEEVLGTGKGISGAGVAGATPLARQAAFGIKNQDIDVGIAYANPNSTAATVTFTLLNTSGTAVGSPVTRTVAANTHAALFIGELFPSVPANFFGSMQITTDASTPIVATTLLFQSDGLFTTLPMVPLL